MREYVVPVIDMGQPSTPAAARMFGRLWCDRADADEVVVVYLDVEGQRACVLAERESG